MAQENDDIFIDRAKDTTKTGRDIPGGDGTVSDEDMNAISGGKKRQKTGQDYSLENYEDSEPTSGIGAIQDYSDRSSDIAHIAGDDEE
jgi:hypothetical protein